MPTVGPHAGLLQFAGLRVDALLHVAPAADMREKGAVRPFLGGTAEQRQEAAAFDLRKDFRRDFGAGELRHGAEHVHVGGQLPDLGGLETSLQAPEGDRAGAAQERRALAGAHAGVEDLGAGGAAVVVHEDDQGVLRDAQLIETGQQAPDVLVDVMDHAEEVLRVLAKPLPFVERGVLGTGVVGTVRGVGGDPGEEGALGRRLTFDPP